MRSLIVASRNPGKAREIRTLLESLEQWDVTPLPADAPDMEETGDTFVENAVQKACFYGTLYGGWTIADDSGLEVDFLGGRPGIYSARYAPTDAERNDRLLGELAGVPDEQREARFVCALALAREGQLEWSVEEHVTGRIARAPAGLNGFGYDPLFYLPDLGRTMGEVDPRVKNRISHRGRALARLVSHLAAILP